MYRNIRKMPEIGDRVAHNMYVLDVTSVTEKNGQFDLSLGVSGIADMIVISAPASRCTLVSSKDGKFLADRLRLTQQGEFQ